MSNLPTGTVTFLFTDIVGSTKFARLNRNVREKAIRSFPSLPERKGRTKLIYPET